MFKPLFSVLSPKGKSARLSVLIFHRVLPVPDPLLPDVPDARQFEQISRWLRSWFNVLPLDSAVQRLHEGTLPARAAALTFDDGYADNWRVAVPILARHGMTATCFVATGFMNGGRMWNDTIIEAVRGARNATLDVERSGLGRYSLADAESRRHAIDQLIDQIKYQPPAERDACVERVAAAAGARLPNDLMMTTDELRNLRRAGMQVGAHTVSHPILATLPDDEATQQITESKRQLEGLLDEKVTLFAYPNGKRGCDYDERHVTMARVAGFRGAFTTNPGVTTAQTDCFEMPRYTPWEYKRLRFGARLARNLGGVV